MTEKEKINLLSFFINETHRHEKVVRECYDFVLKNPTPESSQRLALALYGLTVFRQATKNIKLLLKL